MVMVTKFLGIYISATFSTTVHVEQLLSVANQRLYLLQQLKCQGLSRDGLQCILFSVHAIVLSVVTYALPSFAGQLSIGDKERLDGLFRKAFKRRLCCHVFKVDELINDADRKLFRQISHHTHCLHPLLPQ